jgi:Zinc-finger of the MIZ type in Nse subunit
MRSMNGQLVNGFYLLNSQAIEGQTSFRITRLPNQGRFYPLLQVNLHTAAANNHRIHNSKLKKPRGQTDHECRWKYTSECLRYENEFYPVLTVTPAAFLDSDIIKHESSWVPLREEVNNLRVKIEVKPIEIPTHAVLALLRDAAIQGLTCPITTDEIDVSNGAVTSCFHLFEKNSIATWLANEKSKKQCPVCKKECRSFTL